MNIDVKNSIKLVDYRKSMEILEQRVNDIHNQKKNELLWIIEHKDVYTAGANSKDADLLNKNIKIINTAPIYIQITNILLKSIDLIVP